MNAVVTTTDSTPAKPGWGGPRENAGRRQGGHNRLPAAKIQLEASRHAGAAIAALASIVADPTQPGEARAIAGQVLIQAALADTTPET